jgi:pimeloyl-ACP methyl ester carboxylesterase
MAVTPQPLVAHQLHVLGEERARLGHSELLHALTDDDWALSIQALRPHPALAPRPLDGHGVVLVAGFSQNRHAWLSGRLPALLLEQGLSVFMLELRGHGRSGRRAQLRRHARQKAPLPRDLDFGWGIEAYLRHDLPAAMRVIRAAMGGRKLLYVGHSMGGLLGYGHAARSDDLLGLVTLGAPVAVGSDSWPMRLLARAERAVLAPIDLALSAVRWNQSWPATFESVPMDVLLGWYGALLESDRGRRAHTGLNRVVAARLTNLLHAPPERVAWLLRRSDPEPRRVLLQFARWVREGHLQLDSGEDLGAHLERLTLPTAILYGEADPLAARRSTHPAFARHGGAYVRFRGLPGHGHVDLTMGERVDVVAQELVDLVRFGLG